MQPNYSYNLESGFGATNLSQEDGNKGLLGSIKEEHPSGIKDPVSPESIKQVHIIISTTEKNRVFYNKIVMFLGFAAKSY